MASSSTVNADVNDIRQVALLWTTAVAAADLKQLGRLMSDDIVVIHGNACITSGREAVMADFARFFENFRMKKSIEFEETIIAGDWAFNRAVVHTTISSRENAHMNKFDSRTLTILRRESPHGWCVARLIGVIDQQH